jgi:hypothetical protein
VDHGRLHADRRDLDGAVTLRVDADHDAVCQAEVAHQVVVAPPGTGKTAVAVRLAGALTRDLDPEQRALLVTFSNQARVQLEREASRQLALDVRRSVDVVNYHGFFRREVWAYRRALGLPLDLRFTTWRRRLEVLKAVNADAVAELSSSKGLLDAFAEQRFELFRDERTPSAQVRESLLSAIDAENRAGGVVFDDLGALFWQLLETYPVLDAAYKARYPVVIADEHQDASALQDAFVRRLASQRLVVFADPMQLIYGFRGSKSERLDQHVEDCDAQFELHTPHRWHGQQASGEWLLAVRARLQGNVAAAQRPSAAQIVTCDYFNQMLPRVKGEAASALNGGMDTVAVIAAFNTEVGKLRAYLCKQGLYPRQLGGGDDYEQACAELEQLPLLDDPSNLGVHAMERVQTLVPTLKPNVVTTVKKRLTGAGVNLAGNCGAEAKGLLKALEPLYEFGPSAYFSSVVRALDACASQNHHLPRVEAVRALRATADGFESGDEALEDALARYSANVAVAAQAAPRLGRGVYVMTAHQAKGKEFDAVIIVNCGAAQFPDDPENRRLFYVAITRGSRRWVVMAPTASPTPLLVHLD